MSGIDSAKAARCGGPGFYMHYRERAPRVCPGKGKPCGNTFTPATPNAKYCEECRRPKPSRYTWEL
jgi:hypothetical protein